MVPAPLAPWICIAVRTTQPLPREKKKSCTPSWCCPSLPFSNLPWCLRSVMTKIANIPPLLPSTPMQTSLADLCTPLSNSRCGLNTWFLQPQPTDWYWHSNWDTFACSARSFCGSLSFQPQPSLWPSQTWHLWDSPPRLYLIPSVPNSETNTLPPRRESCTVKLHSSVASRPYSHLLLLFQELQPRVADRSSVYIPSISPCSHDLTPAHHLTLLPWDFFYSANSIWR